MPACTAHHPTALLAFHPSAHAGGAPLARHVEDFLKVTMCCRVVQVGGCGGEPHGAVHEVACGAAGGAATATAGGSACTRVCTECYASRFLPPARLPVSSHLLPGRPLAVLAAPPTHPSPTHPAHPQGYGLTETCAASFIAVPDVWDQAGTVGPPQPVLSFRLEAVPEMNYDPMASPPR